MLKGRYRGGVSKSPRLVVREDFYTNALDCVIRLAMVTAHCQQLRHQRHPGMALTVPVDRSASRVHCSMPPLTARVVVFVACQLRGNAATLGKVCDATRTKPFNITV